MPSSIAEHQEDVAVETIVVDNASGDGTLAIVNECFPDTRVVALGHNQGGPTRNHGLRLAHGRYRMCLDSDVLLTAGALEDLIAFMDSRPDVGLAGPRLVYPDGRLQPSARRLPQLTLPLLRRAPLNCPLENGHTVRRHPMLDVPWEETREAEYVIGACQIFSAAGELDPRIPFALEDIDWCLSIRQAGYRTAYRPQATVIQCYRHTTAR